MLRIVSAFSILGKLAKTPANFPKRGLLSPSYSCTAEWNQRLNSPVLQKVNYDDLYFELDQRYNKTGVISAVDVDIYINCLRGDIHVEEALDILHKLRLSAQTTNTLNSTHHAIVRYLLDENKVEDLMTVLDDRLNYGIFLDYYTANLLMDKFYETKEFVSGARVASQLMLQEECEHALSQSFALLHCYNFLLKPEGWPEPKLPEEPEDEVKIRVKYLRNPYDDEHFDLRDPFRIVGKTLIAFTNNSADSLLMSFNALGWALFGKEEEAKAILQKCKGKLCKEVWDLLPADNPLKDFVKDELVSADVPKLLMEMLKKSEKELLETDIKEQCKVFSLWEQERQEALEKQIERLSIARRLDNIEKTQKELKSKEEKLWFFENEEKIELAIENKRDFVPKRWFDKATDKTKKDEDYIPPEIR